MSLEQFQSRQSETQESITILDVLWMAKLRAENLGRTLTRIKLSAIEWDRLYIETSQSIDESVQYSSRNSREGYGSFAGIPIERIDRGGDFIICSHNITHASTLTGILAAEAAYPDDRMLEVKYVRSAYTGYAGSIPYRSLGNLTRGARENANNRESETQRGMPWQQGLSFGAAYIDDSYRAYRDTVRGGLDTDQEGRQWTTRTATQIREREREFFAAYPGGPSTQRSGSLDSPCVVSRIMQECSSYTDEQLQDIRKALIKEGQRRKNEASSRS